jgi:HSP20 family protein
VQKFILVLSLFAFAAGIAYAETGPSERDYQSLDELRVKLSRMRHEMDRFMRDIIGDYPGQAASLDALGQGVRVDVSETDTDVVVKADLPGMDKSKFEITLDNNKILKISGDREVSRKEESPNMVKQERMSGHFERILEMPVECLDEGIKATYRNGVLNIVMPKKEPGKKESVKINVQ